MAVQVPFWGYVSNESNRPVQEKRQQEQVWPSAWCFWEMPWCFDGFVSCPLHAVSLTVCWNCRCAKKERVGLRLRGRTIMNDCVSEETTRKPSRVHIFFRYFSFGNRALNIDFSHDELKRRLESLVWH